MLDHLGAILRTILRHLGAILGDFRAYMPIWQNLKLSHTHTDRAVRHGGGHRIRPDTANVYTYMMCTFFSRVHCTTCFEAVSEAVGPVGVCRAGSDLSRARPHRDATGGPTVPGALRTVAREI